MAAPSWASAEGSQPLAGMTMPLGGVRVVSLIVSCHAMNALKGARPDSPPNIHASTAQHVAHMRSIKSLFAGPENRRVQYERVRQSGVPLQPLQGGAPSVGRGVLLHRCATGAAWISCPCTLLTSCCVRAWQDRSRNCLRASPRSSALWWPTLRDRHDGVRLLGLRGRSEKRDHLESAPCSHTCLYKIVYVCTHRFSGPL